MFDPNEPTSLKTVARALFFLKQRGYERTEEMFDDAWRWAHDPANAEALTGSEIGQILLSAKTSLEALGIDHKSSSRA